MPHGRKDSWPKIGADRDRRQHALMMLMRQLNRTRNYRSATDPKRTVPQRAASLDFKYMDDLAQLSVASINRLIGIGLGAGVVGSCFPKQQGVVATQGGLDTSSPRGLGRPVKARTH